MGTSWAGHDSHIVSHVLLLNSPRSRLRTLGAQAWCAWGHRIPQRLHRIPRSRWALGSSFSTQAPKEIGELQGAQILLWILALATVLLAGIRRHEALRPGGEGSAAQHPLPAPRASRQQGKATPGCCAAGRALNIQKCLLLLDLLPFPQAQPPNLPAETRPGAQGDARREGGEARRGTAFCCHLPALCATESHFGSVLAHLQRFPF